MSVLPTAGHLASWAGRCPGNDQSAGKRRCGRTRNASKLFGIALQEAALASTRVKGSYLQAQYQRLKPRIRHRRELGGDYYQHRNPERGLKRLVSRLQELGQTATLTPQAAA